MATATRASVPPGPLDTETPSRPAVIVPVAAIATAPPPAFTALNPSRAAVIAPPRASCLKVMPAAPDCFRLNAEPVPLVRTSVPAPSVTVSAVVPSVPRVCVMPICWSPTHENAPEEPDTGSHLLARNLTRSKDLPVSSTRRS